MDVFHTFTTCGLHDVTMTSLADLSRELGIPCPTDAQLRTAVATALGAV
ncbi:hypothetical protein OHA70_14310 [Kribbella sp. NBC_00382]